MPWFYLILLGLALLALAVGGGVYVLVELPRYLRRHLPGGGAATKHIADGSYPGWVHGEDLLRYPGRLAELEERLVAAMSAAVEQATHLRGRRERIVAKEGRSELAQRYEADAGMLDQRVQRMRRVLALVWRTRAILLMRAHVAITARQRPVLRGLPEGEPPLSRLSEAAEAYESAAAQVRDFVVSIESRLADLNLMIPPVPAGSDADPADRVAVDEELKRARATYAALENKLDRLADTLSYLGDRCRTRQVVEEAPSTLQAEPGTETLIDEVNEALGALNDLAELGDRKLADSALDNLAEGISQLEHAGLEAQAEAEAVLEVERLLEQFP